MTTEAPERTADEQLLNGGVIIEWPPPVTRNDWPGTLPGCLVSIFDAGTGAQILTVSKADVIVHVDAGKAETFADLTMFADETGAPVIDGRPRERDGEIITGRFRVRVAGMRVREPGQAA